MNKRKEELEKVKEIIKGTIKSYNCGIFDTRNFAGDPMRTIFKGDYFTLDGCYYYSYYELFGTTNKEFREIKKYYVELLKKVDD